MRCLKIFGVFLVTVALAGVAEWSHAQNAPAPATTTITVPKMHCMGCAKTMAGQLYKVAGVGQVFANVEATTMTVRAKEGQAPSPRGLWEAVERAGYQPSRLQGPSGVFTSKPKS